MKNRSFFVFFFEYLFFNADVRETEKEKRHVVQGDLCFYLQLSSDHSAFYFCFLRSIFVFNWATGLGIGFWLRGVQPRTTMR